MSGLGMIFIALGIICILIVVLPLVLRIFIKRRKKNKKEDKGTIGKTLDAGAKVAETSVRVATSPFRIIRNAVLLFAAVVFIMLGMYINQLGSLLNSTVTTYLNLFGKEEEEIAEEEEVEGWTWDSETEEWVNTVTGETSDTYPLSTYSSYSSSAYAHGNAGADSSATCVVTLNDGTYYWYHQNGGGNALCSPNDYDGGNVGGSKYGVYGVGWSNMTWGTSGDSGYFGKDGCAVYSLAIGISNLVGSQITPFDVLEACGCTFTTKAGSIQCVTSSSGAFSGKGIIRENALSALSSAYNLSYNGINKSTAEIVAVLDAGGYVWTSWVDSDIAWASGTESHFMIIRGYTGSVSSGNVKFYCFTSCRGSDTSLTGVDGAIYTMNDAIDATVVINAMTNTTPYAIYYNGASEDTSSDSSADTGSSSSSGSSLGTLTGYAPGGVALRGSSYEEIIWNWLTDIGYSQLAAAAIMGNIYQESKYDPGATQNNTHDYQWLSKCSTGADGDGHGLFQWDSSRRIDLYNFANSVSLQWYTIEANLGFFYKEITSTEKTKGGIAVMNAYTDLNDATDWFVNKFERAGQPDYEKRRAEALRIYNKYAS